MKSPALLTALLIGLTAAPLRPAQADIFYSDFSTTNGMTLVGNAAQSGSALRFQGPDSAMAGAAWYGAKLAVTAGYESEFTFRMIDVTPEDEWGHYPKNGLTFTIQDRDPLVYHSLVGGAYGYDGITRSTAVAFSPFSDGSHRRTRIRVMREGDAYRTEDVYPDWPIPPDLSPDIADGETHTVRLVYDSSGYPTLRVYIDDMTRPWSSWQYRHPSATDYRSVYVGFTAGNEAGTGIYDILSWRAHGVPEPGTLALLGATALGTAVRRAGARRRPADRAST